MAKRKKPPKFVWVSRDKPASFPSETGYDIYTTKPILYPSGFWGESEKGVAVTFGCPAKEFVKLYGFEIPPGTCRRFEWRSPLVEVKGRKVKT